MALSGPRQGATMNRPTLAISLALLASVACADHSLAATDYKRKCTMDPECIDVFIGDACSTCRCSNDAINVSDQARYQKDLDAAANCGPEAPVCNIACMFKPPVCQDGTCVLP